MLGFGPRSRATRLLLQSQNVCGISAKDVHAIDATNGDLLAFNKQRTFGEDPYYPLTLLPRQLPSPRERKDDIPWLAQFLLSKYRARIGRLLEGITKVSLDRRMAYHWPGNVSELENPTERAMIRSAGLTVEFDPHNMHAAPITQLHEAQADRSNAATIAVG